MDLATVIGLIGGAMLVLSSIILGGSATIFINVPGVLIVFVGKICELKLVSLNTEKYMRIWNELMIQDHPRGAGPLVGRQLRYIIQSEHGRLGGISFSSAALHPYR